MSDFTISFLATGNEIIEGETSDSNGQYFARTLHDLGANIYQHLQVSDQRDEICKALFYLLENSNAVIMTGGLGPTSDDNTRFAVSEFTGIPLQLDENSWANIEERFKKFHLKLVPSNRQQALFPEGATIYPNLNGTAPGCYLSWNDKHIFMLPGPPKECRPIFETHIIPTLKSLSCFNENKKTYRWLTLGLSESEIGEKIDALAKNETFDTGFRWSYPYLEIKVMSKSSDPDMTVIDRVDTLLQSNTVSKNRLDALESLFQALKDSQEIIYLIDEANLKIEHPNVVTINASDRLNYPCVLTVNADDSLSGVVTFTCEGYQGATLTYAHKLSVPNAGPHVLQYAKAYGAWQLRMFMMNKQA